MFDSGVGGLSVLRAMHAAAPQSAFCYIADSAHAPYGERSASHVLERSMLIAGHLIACGARGIVVACNTATAIAIQHLRERWPQLPIIGVEPGLKPAVAATRNGRIGVMATPATLASERFARLRETQTGGTFVLAQACPGLAHLIEQGDLDSPALAHAIERFCGPLRRAQVDTVVLGCTHYPLIAERIQLALGAQVLLIDTAQAVARHAAQQFRFARSETTLLEKQTPGRPKCFSPPRGADDVCRRPGGALGDDSGVRLLTTGDAQALRKMAETWLPFPVRVQHTDIDQPAARAA